MGQRLDRVSSFNINLIAYECLGILIFKARSSDHYDSRIWVYNYRTEMLLLFFSIEQINRELPQFPRIPTCF